MKLANYMGVAACVAAVVASTLSARAEQVTVVADRDNTLYQDAQGDVSNGQGVDIFAGRTDVGSLRRAVVHFDLSNIPPGSTVTSVTVQMRLNRARTGTFDVSFHRALADWGEGTSNDTNSTGQGTVATPNDATWLHQFYPGVFWSTPGGDFVPAASATTAVSAQNGFFQWTGAGLASDVQSWVDTPANNFGWVVVGTETVNTTARRFDSSEAGTVANRPSITVVYTPPASPTGACCLNDGTCVVLTQFNCGLQGGTYRGDNTSCSPNPCPQPTGACCLGGAACLVTTQASCNAQGGVYQGNGTACAPNPCLAPVTVTLVPAVDNILYNSLTPTSNALGFQLWVGNSNQGITRRSLVRFDLSSIPTGAVVQSASLRLNCNTSQGGAIPVSISRALSSWGEGTSQAAGDESVGAPASINDATWAYRFFNSTTWTAPGGDFVAAPSASVNIGATGSFTWTGTGVATDVQTWIATPSANHGWIIRGEENANNRSRRFDSRHSQTPALQPSLSVTYLPPVPTGACCVSGGVCSVQTGAGCTALGGVYQGDATTCSPNPCLQPTGACCLPSGLCVTATAASCAGQGGNYRGDASLCANQTCPIVLTPYVDALPRPGVAQPVSGVPGGAAHYEIAITEQFQQLHRDLPPSRVWGYAGSYPGPTIEARSGQPVTVDWRNDLRVAETGQLRTTHALPVDTCLHGPDMTGTVPVTVVHLHGSKDDSESDGQPEATFPPGQGAPTYSYPNDQPAATIWYHDHALGITRLNVYMGTAGFYLIRDDTEEALNLPRGLYEVPMAIQDRSFNPDGSLKYLDTWMEHFFGDFLLVNGKVWPYLNVDRGKYRFRLLNGSTSRTYTLSLPGGTTFWQIGTDSGLMGAPVALTSLTIQPGERADVIVDFAPYTPGTEVILTNSAMSPYPNGGAGPDIPNVMKFIVGANAGHTAPLPASLVPFVPIPETSASRQRDFELRRSGASTCPGHTDGMWMINGLAWNDITEFPRLNSTEIWAWINRSGVSHPMHMHLVSFQVLDRQAFTIVNDQPVPTGPRSPPRPNEVGWKDTVEAPPGLITRVITRFKDFTGVFPYHCHILEHEDHEMMRQFVVVCPADFDDGTGSGTPDGGIGIEDLLYYLNIYDAGLPAADLDDGIGTGTPDGGVGIEDLLYYLLRYDTGC